jgi:hypothetical protein
MVEIDFGNFEDRLQKAKEVLGERKELLKKIIDPFWNDCSDEKKKLELCDVAKFIALYNPRSVLEALRESPDFILSMDGKSFGLELRQLFSKSVERQKFLQSLLDGAAERYAMEYPNEKMLANVGFVDGFMYRRSEKSGLEEKIVSFVKSAIEKNGIPQKSEVLSFVDLQPHTSLEFFYQEGAYTQEIVTQAIIDAAIDEKEAKIAEYISNTGIVDQVLLLVSREAGSSSYDTSEIKQVGRTKFTKVFLLKDFDFELIELG